MVVAGGITFFSSKSSTPPSAIVTAPPGTAVGDLQQLDKNHDVYADFDVLDDLQVQQNVEANP